MKPLKGDVYSSSRGESYVESQIPKSDLGGRRGGLRIDGKPELTINDAFSYLKEVKDMFSDQRLKYSMFLLVMNDFKKKRIDTVGVIEKAKELFKKHPNLLLGLNPFLPKSYEIILNDKDEKKIDSEQALSFMNKIKKRLGNDQYKSFIDILFMLKEERNDVKEVYHKAVVLLNDHPDLLDELAKFLPDLSTVNLLSNLIDDKLLMK